MSRIPHNKSIHPTHMGGVKVQTFAEENVVSPSLTGAAAGVVSLATMTVLQSSDNQTSLSVLVILNWVCVLPVQSKQMVSLSNMMNHTTPHWISFSNSWHFVFHQVRRTSSWSSLPESHQSRPSYPLSPYQWPPTRSPHRTCHG